MNAYEVLGIEDAVLILEKSRFKLAWSIAAADRFGNLEIWIARHNKMNAYLTCGVNYLRREILTAILDDLAECVLDGWIVAVHKMCIHVLHCERGFAW